MGVIFQTFFLWKIIVIFFLSDVDFMRYYKLFHPRYSFNYIVLRYRTRQNTDLEGRQRKFCFVLVLTWLVFRGCTVSAPTFWHRCISFGGDILAPNRFGTDNFWRRCVYAFFRMSKTSNRFLETYLSCLTTLKWMVHYHNTQAFSVLEYIYI